MSFYSTLKLSLLPVVGFVSAAALAYISFFTPSQREFYNGSSSGCSVPARKRIPTDLTQGNVPQIDDALCVMVPILKQLVAQRSSIASGALVFSSLLPILMRQCYQASSPNTHSIFLGPLAVLVIHFIGKVTGVGIALASVGTLFLTLGSYQELKRSAEAEAADSMPIVPTPAGSVYWSNLFLVIFTALVVSITSLDVSGSIWTLVSLALLFYPVWLTLLLLLATFGVTSPKDEREARSVLLDYTADQLSYAFERKWSYYRKAALGSMAAYWFGLVRFGWAYQERSFHISGIPVFLLCDFIGIVIYTILAIRIERLTIRCTSPVHPLTGKARSRTSLDCSKAIALAPAGNPSLERGTWQPIVAGILCGPGMASALWWSGGEEEDGWMARRAWREAAAVRGAKKQ